MSGDFHGWGPTTDPLRPRPTDNAVFRKEILGGATEPTYGGVLSFMRRRFFA